jgi:hypothetical protein
MHHQQLIVNYLAGVDLIRRSITGLSTEQLHARPIPGKWSIAEVVCHLADFEIVGSDRIKRVVAEDDPLLVSADENRFIERLSYDTRDPHRELELIALIRQHTASILQSLTATDFERKGRHSTDGEMTLDALIGRVTRHVVHHVTFIDEKRRALGLNT